MEAGVVQAGKRSRHRLPRSAFFWVLILLSLATLFIAVWQWRDQRQSANARASSAQRQSASFAPDFRLTTVDGTEIALSDLRGNVVLLNFWATWCPPCKAEMPDLDALYREFGAAHGFVVLAIDLEEGQDEVRAFGERYGLSFPLLLDLSGEVTSKQFAVRSLPTSMIIDRDGLIRDVWTGQLSRPAMRSRLEAVWQER